MLEPLASDVSELAEQAHVHSRVKSHSRARAPTRVRAPTRAREPTSQLPFPVTLRRHGPTRCATSNTVKVPETASITRWSALCGVPGRLAVSDPAAHLEVMTRALTSPPASQASRRARMRGQH